MHYRSSILATLSMSLLLVACSTNAIRASPNNESRELDTLVEKHFDERLAMDSMLATYAGYPEYNDRFTNYLSPEFRAHEQQLEAHYLEAARQIDASRLSDKDRVTLEVFLHDRRMKRDAAQFPAHLLPLTQFFSIQNQVPSLATGKGAQPFRTVEDYDNWISRVEDFAVLMRQAQANMRAGMARGVVLPRVIVERMIPQLEVNIVAEPEQSLFWMPIENFPAGFDAAERERLARDYRAMITQTVTPLYADLRDFLRDEYLPAARESAGLHALPDGDAWYRHLVQYYTTTAAEPEELHQLGLERVARNLDEMRKVMRSTGHDGELSDWFEYLREDDRFYYATEAEVLDAYRAIESRMDAAVPKLFNVRPEAPFEVRPIPAHEAASGPGAYYQQPSTDGSRPGVFYVNTHNLKAQPAFGMETLFMHEAVPGHHFQRGLQIEIDDLPRFRRFGGYSAYTEGWALYAESLGRELGFYADPLQWYGHLSADQLRAMRLVVDTGLHYKGWSREQAIRYMMENSSMAESDVVAEVERYMVIPGQALSFKVGQRKIRELRERAAEQLGDAFDVREYHRQVLIDGPLPLNVLEGRIDRWIETQRNSD